MQVTKPCELFDICPVPFPFMWGEECLTIAPPLSQHSSSLGAVSRLTLTHNPPAVLECAVICVGRQIILNGRCAVTKLLGLCNQIQTGAIETAQQLRALVGCSCRRSRFSSQHIHGSSQPSLTSSRGFSALLWLPQALPAHGTHTWRRNNHTHKITDKCKLKWKIIMHDNGCCLEDNLLPNNHRKAIILLANSELKIE